MKYELCGMNPGRGKVLRSNKFGELTKLDHSFKWRASQNLKRDADKLHKSPTGHISQRYLGIKSFSQGL